MMEWYGLVSEYLQSLNFGLRSIRCGFSPTILSSVSLYREHIIAATSSSIDRP